MIPAFLVRWIHHWNQQCSRPRTGPVHGWLGWSSPNKSWKNIEKRNKSRSPRIGASISHSKSDSESHYIPLYPIVSHYILFISQSESLGKWPTPSATSSQRPVAAFRRHFSEGLVTSSIRAARMLPAPKTWERKGDLGMVEKTTLCIYYTILYYAMLCYAILY